MRRADRTIIERGMDAMMDAVENGGDRRSLFPHATGDQNKYENKGNGGQGPNVHDDMVDE
jgi:hypothetical protein